MVLKSFLEVAGKGELNSSCRFVELEHACKRDGDEVTETTLRLDILIHTQEEIIGIEHKINAPLYNDIATYKNELESLSLKYSKPNHAFVLSLKSVQEIKKLRDSLFEPVQYLDFIQKVKDNMKGLNFDKSSKYAFMLNDFLDTLKSYKMSIINDEKKYQFYQGKRDSIQALVKEFEFFKQEMKEVQILLYKRLMVLANEVNVPKPTDWRLYNPEEYDNNSIFFQRLLNEQAIGLELTMTATEKSPTGLIELHLVYWGNEIEEKHKLLWKSFVDGLKHFQSENSLEDCSDGNKGLIKLFTFEGDALSDTMFKAIIKYYEDEFITKLKSNWDFGLDKFKGG